jgi:hypothetical protein
MVPGRVVRRDVERVEIVELILNMRARCDLESQAEEDAFQPLERPGDDVLPPDPGRPPREREIEAGHTPRRRLDTRGGRREGGREQSPELVHGLPDGASFALRKRA